MKWLSLLRTALPLAIPVALFAAMYLLVGMIEKAAYDSGYSTAQTEGALALERLRSEHQEQELARARAAEASAKTAAKRLQEEQARNDSLASDLAEQQRQHRPREGRRHRHHQHHLERDTHRKSDGDDRRESRGQRDERRREQLHRHTADAGARHGRSDRFRH